jgi:hypothetical protein
MAFANTYSIANTGATSMFGMAGIPMSNIHPAMDPLSINLPKRDIVHLTHVCSIVILGFPMILTGHIVPGLFMGSLMGMHVLCKGGCKVIFTNTKCEVKYQNKVILHSIKDPATNLGPSLSLQLPSSQQGIAY